MANLIYWTHKLGYWGSLYLKLFGLSIIACYQFVRLLIDIITKPVDQANFPTVVALDDQPDETDGWTELLILSLFDSAREFLQQNCRISLIPEQGAPPALLIISNTETDFLEPNGFRDIEEITRRFYQAARIRLTVVVEPTQILNVVRNDEGECAVYRVFN